MRSLAPLLIVAAISGCTYSLGPPMAQPPAQAPQHHASPTVSPAASPYEMMSSQEMCQAYRDPQVDVQVRRNLEVELVQRGERVCGGLNIGMTSVIQMGRSKYIRTELQSRDGTSCADFASAAEAQKVFLAKGGPHQDPSMLDPDGDGLACGWGDTLKEVATTAPS
jgi:hypothetical protein